MVRLRGVSHSGSEYGCVQKNPDGSQKPILEGSVDRASALAIKRWGNNVVRIPLNEDCYLGINGAGYSSQAYQAAIKGYVDTLLAEGLYVILDLHWTASGSTLATQQDPMPDASHSAAFWSSVASQFNYSQHILFEIFNEPFPGKGSPTADDWACWRNGTCASDTGVGFSAAGMETLVKAVRGTGAQNVLLLGGLAWSNYLQGWLDAVPVEADPLHNIGCVWHSYDFNQCNSESCWTSTVQPVLEQYPVVVTVALTCCVMRLLE